MNRYRYAIRSIDPLSALKYGFVLGCVVAILPGFLTGAALQQFIAAIVVSISSGLFAPDLGPLTPLYQMGWGLTWWVTLFAVVGGGIVSAISSVVGALVYNLVAAISGGLAVTTDLLDQPGAASFPAPLAATSAPALPAPAAHIPTATPPAPVAVGPALPASPAGEMYWLALRDQPAQRWPLRQPVTTIGAAPGCDIVLPGLAPQHAEIHLENDRCILYDRSDGHSWVNGRQITTANMLKEGFTVRLAAVELLVVR